MTLLINMIGAGRLGRTIGHLLMRHPLVTIGAICNTSLASSMQAIHFIGAGTYCASISELPAADITFITTPDDVIATTCNALSTNQLIQTGSIVLHCSGNLSSDSLMSIKEKGCYVASVHPMRSFADPELSVAHYSGTHCAMEGDIEAISILESLFNAIGSISYSIEKAKKPLYHAAGVFASNYLVTLSQKALMCLQEAGVEDNMAMQMITNIMKGTVANLEQTLSPEQSLTGPIKRGDTATIKQHVTSFTASEQRELYALLGKATLSLTDHSEAKRTVIEDAFNN